MTEPLRIQRVIDAPPDVVFETFLTDDGQAAFYGEDDPGWVLEGGRASGGRRVRR
jgi:uncharacterized protein YndB with AHSA1/START domain